MKIGVYVAAGPNPIFLRAFMMQLARQTRYPDVISIYENGNKTAALGWCCKDAVQQLISSGVKILHKHEPEVASSAKRYYVPLKQVFLHDFDGLGNGVDVILKMDLDDFYEDKYIENMVSILGNYDIAINQNSGLLLVRPFHGDFKYKDKIVMDKSPIGAAPSHVVFNRKFAERYLGFLSHQSDTNGPGQDDELMMEAMLVDTNINRVDGPVDYIYVSHGTNYSSWGWQQTGGKVYFKD